MVLGYGLLLIISVSSILFIENYSVLTSISWNNRVCNRNKHMYCRNSHWKTMGSQEKRIFFYRIGCGL